MKFLRDVDVAEMLGIKRATVWIWAKEGKIPKPIKISGKCARWRAEDLEKWEQALVATGEEGEDETPNQRKTQKNKPARTMAKRGGNNTWKEQNG